MKAAKAKSGGTEELSPQERRVLAQVVEGKTNKQIALALGLSDKTVKNYLSNAFQKLQVNRRSHAAVVYSRLVSKGTQSRKPQASASGRLPERDRPLTATRRR